MDVSTAFQHLERDDVLEDVTIQGILLQLDDRFIVVDISEDPSAEFEPKQYLAFADPAWNDRLLDMIPIRAGGDFLYLNAIQCRARVDSKSVSDSSCSALIGEPASMRFADLSGTESWTAELLPTQVWQGGALPLESEDIDAGHQQELCFLGRCVGFMHPKEGSHFYLEHSDTTSDKNRIFLGGQDREPVLSACIPLDAEYVEGGGLRGSQIVVVRGLIGKGHGEFEHEFRELSCISVPEEDCIRNLVFDSRRCVFDLAVEG